MSGSVTSCWQCGQNTWAGKACQHCGAPEEPPQKLAYCPYCKRQTPHKCWSLPNKEGTGGKLTCSKCGSARLDQIQGFDAALM